MVMATDYEFTEEQNKVIAGCVTMARVSAGCLFALGGVKIVAGLPKGDFGGVIYMVFAAVLGAWFLQTAAALDKIVKTEGDDLIHLADAFRRIAVIFRGIRNAQILLIAIVIVMLLIAVAGFVASH